MSRPTSKVLSFALAVAVVFTMLPVMAFAEGEVSPDDPGLATTTGLVVAAFDKLDDYTLYQGYDAGTVTQGDLDLPETLTGTGADGEAVTIYGVTWQSAPGFDPEKEIAYPGYIFTPTLPEGYIPADGVKAPVITVFIRPNGGVQIMPLANGTATWDSTTPPDISSWAGGSNTITVSAGAGGTLVIPDTVESLTIDGGGETINGTIDIASRTGALELTLKNLTINSNNMNGALYTNNLSSSALTINIGGTVTLNGTPGYETLHINDGNVTITGGILIANGGDNVNGTGGNGIYILYGNLTVKAGTTIEAKGGNGGGGHGGNGIYVMGNIINEGTGTIIAAGGNGGTIDGYGGAGGDGITAFSGEITNGIGGTITGTGGDGGDGIGFSGGLGGSGVVASVKIENNGTITATGGTSGSSTGGTGNIGGHGVRTDIVKNNTGGKIIAAGGNGGNGNAGGKGGNGSSGIQASVDLENSGEIEATGGNGGNSASGNGGLGGRGIFADAGNITNKAGGAITATGGNGGNGVTPGTGGKAIDTPGAFTQGGTVTPTDGADGAGHNPNPIIRNNSSGNSGSSPTVAAPTTTWLEQTPAATLATGAKNRGENYVRTRSTGAYGVRGGAWQKLAELRYEHDTVADGAVQVRAYIDNPTKFTKDTFVSAHVKGSEVDRVKAHFEKWFKNKLSVIHLDQQGSFGQPVELAAKTDPTMDTAKLVFYSYDRAANAYRRIDKPAHWLDTNGYLHFTTTLAGDIIISEGALEKK